MSTYPYTYDDLLCKLHDAKSAEEPLHSRNSSIDKKISLPPLNVARKNKLSIISNFGAYPELLNREVGHISNYFTVETGTANSINNMNQLVIQNVINENRCESIMRKYIREFCMCRQCRGISTTLLKQDGITFIECNECNAKTSLGKL